MKREIRQEALREDLDLLDRMRLVMREMPDIDFGRIGEYQIPTDCHMVARAFANHFPVTVKDGYFIDHGWPHSWVLTPNCFVIDLYPIRMEAGGPVLVSIGIQSPWRDAYRVEESPAFSRMLADPLFLERVETVSKAVEETIIRLRQIVPVLL